eukprot:IDg12894t1
MYRTPAAPLFLRMHVSTSYVIEQTRTRRAGSGKSLPFTRSICSLIQYTKKAVVDTVRPSTTRLFYTMYSYIGSTALSADACEYTVSYVTKQADTRRTGAEGPLPFMRSICRWIYRKGSCIYGSCIVNPSFLYSCVGVCAWKRGRRDVGKQSELRFRG